MINKIINLHCTQLTHQLSFRNKNLSGASYRRQVVYLRPQTPQGELVAKPGTLLLISLISICKSDIKDVHGNVSNPFFEKNVRREKHHRKVGKCRNSIPYINHFIQVNNANWLDRAVANDLTKHYRDVRMCAMASQITILTIVYWTGYSDADQRKHQSSASLAFVRGIHRRPVNSWSTKGQ